MSNIVDQSGVLFNDARTKLLDAPEHLIGYYVVPDGVEVLADQAFCNCTDLNVRLPQSIRQVGKFAFAWCESLHDIFLPEGVLNVEEYTFYGCVGLAAIHLPDTLLSIGDGRIWVVRESPADLPAGWDS